MAKKIRITEEQLKKVMNIVTEQSFDDALTKFQKERDREIPMSKADANLLLTLAQNWCEGKVTHPDCEEVEELGKKLKLN